MEETSTAKEEKLLHHTLITSRMGSISEVQTSFNWNRCIKHFTFNKGFSGLDSCLFHKLFSPLISRYKLLLLKLIHICH